MRLIDADRLKDELKTLPMMSNWGEIFMPLLIDEQPTAYDIDKVVEKLEDHAIEFEAFGICSNYVELTHAIAIVKGGAE